MSDIKTNLNVAPYNDTTELELAKGYLLLSERGSSSTKS